LFHWISLQPSITRNEKEAVLAEKFFIPVYKCMS